MNQTRPPPIFDRKLARRHRQRAAARFAEHSALHDAVRDELAERLAGVTRGFPSVLLLGGAELAVKGAEFVVTDGGVQFLCHPPTSSPLPSTLLRSFDATWHPDRAVALAKAGKGGRASAVLSDNDTSSNNHDTDSSPLEGARCEGIEFTLVCDRTSPVGGWGVTPAPNYPIVFDDETLPFAAHSFDLIISHLALQTVNDVPGHLARIYTLLKPGGLFLAAFAGGYTLHEFRGCLMEAELAVTGGVSPRLHPTISLTDASTLLQRAGFQLPVTDNEVFTLTYPDAFHLMRDLRGMGAGNVLQQRLKIPTRRAVFVEAAKLYQEKFGAGGRIPASFDIIFLHGWKS